MLSYNGENDIGSPTAKPLRWLYRHFFIIYTTFSMSVCTEFYFDFRKVAGRRLRSEYKRVF